MSFEALDRETKAQALVGAFLSEFAIAEEQVTTVLALLFDLSDTQRSLLLDGMPVGQKFKALKLIAPDLPAEIDREQIGECATKLLLANDQVRVHIAHKRFGAGFKDLVVLRPGHRDEVLVAWSESEFRERIGKLLSTRRPLWEASNTLSTMVADRVLTDAFRKMVENMKVQNETLFFPGSVALNDNS